MSHELIVSQARVLELSTTHAIIGSQDRDLDAAMTQARAVLKTWMVKALMSHRGAASVATTSQRRPCASSAASAAAAFRLL